MALATAIVAELFWRQFVVLRTVENVQVSAQTRLLLRSAQDWARALLLDQPHPAYDTLTDSWSQGLARTSLADLGESAPVAARASLEGGIEDAQARLNLRNLVGTAGEIDPDQLASLRKLAGLLGGDPASAERIANHIRAAYSGSAVAAPPPATAEAAAAFGGVPGRPVPIVFPEDLARVPGVDTATAALLAPFVVVLDQAGTPVNFNTARAEVMAAVLPELTMADAVALAGERDRAYFNSVSDLTNRLHGRASVPAAQVSTNTQYFIVSGVLRLDRAVTRQRSLLHRSGAGNQAGVQVLWEQDD
jgi:general secretion pathway protein K